MISVIFPAAGQAKRMHVGLNKVFLGLAGMPMLVRTLLTFSAIPKVGEMIIAVAEDEIESVTKLLKRIAGLAPFKVVAGGAERQYSIYNGLKQVSPEAEIILVHDAARPLIQTVTIEAVIEKAKEKRAAIAAVPVKNTIKIVDSDGVVESTPPRASLWAVQTPQGFHKDLLLEAYAKAEEDNFLGTDDASLVERLGVPVHVVMGDYSNIKVTTPEDMFVAEAFLRDSMGAGGLMKKALSEAKKILGGTISKRGG